MNSVPDENTFSSINSPVTHQKSTRGNIFSGQRYPRSIPLARMLERRLASVPEEPGNPIAETSGSFTIPHGTQDLQSKDKESSMLGSSEVDHNNAKVISASLTTGGNAGSDVKEPMQGVELSGKLRYKGKKPQMKGKAGARVAGKGSDALMERENAEPKDRSVPHRKSQYKQGQNTGKPKVFKNRRKET